MGNRPETADGPHDSLRRAKRFPHGAGRRPQPVAARKRFTFWPAAINSPWVFTLSTRCNWTQRKPCHSFASANSGSTQTCRLRIAF